MLQDLLPLLPRESGPAAAIVAAAAAVFGLALWLTGSRYSRYLITLVAVAVGTIVGQNLPRWCNWPIGGPAFAVTGALLLGLSGYVMHRAWVGAGLGLILALWGGIASWVLAGVDPNWAWPASSPIPQFLSAVWQQLPAGPQRAMPIIGGLSLLAGILAAVWWPRGAVVMLYSLAGMGIAALMGLAAVQLHQPDWIKQIPPDRGAQAAAIGVLIALGAIIQWWLAPPGPKIAPAKKTR